MLRSLQESKQINRCQVASRFTSKRQEMNFESSRDTVLLQGAFLSAENFLIQQSDKPSLSSLTECHKEAVLSILATAIFNIYREVKESHEQASTKNRIHAVIFSNLLLHSGIARREQLEYFESVLEDFPVPGWDLYCELVKRCLWKRPFIQCFAVLPRATRLKAVLAVSDSLFVDSSCRNSYVLNCLASVIQWSVFIEPFVGCMKKTEDSILKVFSFLTCKEDETGFISKLESMLFKCIANQQLLLNAGCCRTNAEDVVKFVLNLILEFSCSLLKAKEYQQNTDEWLLACSEGSLIVDEDCYLQSSCCFVSVTSTVTVMNIFEKSKELFHLICELLSHPLCKDIIFNESVQHSLCNCRRSCYLVLIQKQSNAVCLEEENVFHLLGKALENLIYLKTLYFSEFCGRNVNQVEVLITTLSCFVELHPKETKFQFNDAEISNVLSWVHSSLLEYRDDALLLILNSRTLLEKEKILEVLENNKTKLFHPRFLGPFMYAIGEQNHLPMLKEIFIKVCQSAPFPCQKAILKCCLSVWYPEEPLKLDSFGLDLTVSLNQIVNGCDMNEIKKQIVCLCIQSPNCTLNGLVMTAVSSGQEACKLITQLLVTISPACCHGNLLMNLLQKWMLETKETDTDAQTCFIKFLEYLSTEKAVFDCHAFVVFLTKQLMGTNTYQQNLTLDILKVMHTKDKLQVAVYILCHMQLLDWACKKLDGQKKEAVLGVLKDFVAVKSKSSKENLNELDHEWLLRRVLSFSMSANIALGTILGDCCGCWKKDLPVQEDIWRKELNRMQHTDLSAEDVLLPHMAWHLAGATLEEWQTCCNYIKSFLNMSEGKEVIQYLIKCIVFIKRKLNCYNYSYLFNNFCILLKDLLPEPHEDEVSYFLRDLLFLVYQLPIACQQQALLLMINLFQHFKPFIKCNVEMILKKTDLENTEEVEHAIHSIILLSVN